MTITDPRGSDPTAADELAVTHLPLVSYHVNEMLARVPASVSRSDLRSAGQLALLLAARSYDPATGVPFSRYAALRIRGALVDELRAMDWATRGARRRAREVATATDRLTAALGRAPSRAELSTALGTDVAAVDQARQDVERRVLSIEAAVRPVADLLPDGAPNPEESLLAGERLRYLRAAVAALPERLRIVVHGLFFEDRTAADLAADLGVTPSRISQLRTEGLALLRDGLNANLDPGLLPQPVRPDGIAERRRRTYYAAVAAQAALTAVAVAAAGRAMPTGVGPAVRNAVTDREGKAGL